VQVRGDVAIQITVSTLVLLAEPPDIEFRGFLAWDTVQFEWLHNWFFSHLSRNPQWKALPDNGIVDSQPVPTTIPELPGDTNDVSIDAVSDRPISCVEDRVPQIGEVFQTLQSSASLTISLFDLFPTDFNWKNCATIAQIGEIMRKRSQSSQLIKSAHNIAGDSPETERFDISQSVRINFTAQFSTLEERALPLA
jgi:hypothetical protein